MINWTEIIIAGIGIIFTSAIIPLVAAGFKWLRSKTQNEAIKAAISEAEKIADQTIYSLQQTVVDGLKQKNEDGKLTADEAKEVMELAIHNFIADVSSNTLSVLSQNADNIEQYIKNLIESRLYFK